MLENLGEKGVRAAKKEAFILVLLVLFVALLVTGHLRPSEMPSLIDGATMVSLTGLLITATGIRDSGYFSLVSMKLLRKIRDERALAIFLCSFSALLAAFLTNDVALFIVVPLTLSAQGFLRNDLSKLVVFEAISVNVGSALTPIGNPQNIYLWHRWGISFAAFSWNMLPLFLAMFVTLLIYIYVVFPARDLRPGQREKPEEVAAGYNQALFFSSAALFVSFVVSVEAGLSHFFLPCDSRILRCFLQKNAR